jgi:hypothetical protein
MNGCNKSILFLKGKKHNSDICFQERYETFRILDPFTLTLVTVLLASFFPPAAVSSLL